MTVESVTYLNDLNVAYPAVGDIKSEGDDHFRNIKTALKNTLPNLGGRAWRRTAKAGTSETLVAADNMTLQTFTNSSPIAVTLTDPGTVGNGWICIVLNSGVGTATFTPASGTINGAANYALVQGEAAVIHSFGTTYVAFLLGYLRMNATHLEGLQQTAANTANTIMRRDASANTAATDVSVKTLTVRGEASNGMLLYDRDTSGDYWHIYHNANNLSFWNSVAAQDRFIIGQDGTGYFDGDVIAYYSDARLKTNVVSLKYMAQDIWRVNPVSFEWADHRLAKEPGKRALGFIAQEVVSWCPEAVEEREDPRVPGEKFLWVNYEMLIPVAFQIIKDLENKVRGFDRFVLPRVEHVAKLEKRVDELEARLAVLEAK